MRAPTRRVLTALTASSVAFGAVLTGLSSSTPTSGVARQEVVLSSTVRSASADIQSGRPARGDARPQLSGSEIARAAAVRRAKALAEQRVDQAKEQRAREAKRERARKVRERKERRIRQLGYQPGTTAPRQIARQIMKNKFDWGRQEFSCYDKLIKSESQWEVKATNPSSGAYGIPQALPARKMATVADDWRTNPATQIIWGLGYVEDRYGTPCSAWSFKQGNNWY